MLNSESKYTPTFRADAAGVMSLAADLDYVDRKLVLPARHDE
jgi:hypothetical protein